MTQAITPRSAANMLHVHHSAFYSLSAIASLIVAVFQDTTANALAVAIAGTAAAYCTATCLDYWMVAGTTSATTFKIRAGSLGAGTTINGSGGARLFGGALISSMTITEYVP